MQIIAPLLSLFTQGILSAFFPPIFQSPSVAQVQFSVPPFVMILLPIVLPILQLGLVGGPFQLYYFFYIAMVPN